MGRRKSLVKKPVSAFTEREMDALYDVVRKLYLRRIKVGRLVLTFEEYVHSFVPQPARDIFFEAAPWISTPNYARWELAVPDGGTMKMTLNMCEINRVPAPPLPRHLALQPDAPQEVVDRIMQWVAHGDASREFGRVRKVLETFNVMGWSRLAIRYYWPTILALLSEGRTSLKEYVPELQDLRVPPKLQPLPQGLQTACRQTAETIASVRLIPPDIDEPDPGEVMLDIISGQEYEEQVGLFTGMS